MVTVAAANVDFFTAPDESPRFFVDTPQVSDEIGAAWVTAHTIATPARAPRAINPRRGR